MIQYLWVPFVLGALGFIWWRVHKMAVDLVEEEKARHERNERIRKQIEPIINSWDDLPEPNSEMLKK